jgi:hypothetical protein
LSFSEAEQNPEKELKEINNMLLKELKSIDIKLLKKIFDLPMHFYYFPITKNDKKLFSNTHLFENDLFKNCFFESPVLF